jgi:hypothetical protein
MIKLVTMGEEIMYKKVKESEERKVYFCSYMNLCYVWRSVLCSYSLFIWWPEVFIDFNHVSLSREE